MLSKLAHQNKIKQLIHVSALGIDKAIDSEYAISKLNGEKNVLKCFNKALILRPSIVFGPEDKFFNTFASLAQFSPILPLIGNGKTRFAPIYVEDVAKAIVKSLQLNNSKTKIFELGGPKNYTFKELMELLLKEIKKIQEQIEIEADEKNNNETSEKFTTQGD